MLNKLLEIEKSIPQLLETKEIWNSVYVDYHKPYVKRLWCQVDNTRIYLHKIFPCEVSEALIHPHPWPSAMKVINGKYYMGLGKSTTDAPTILNHLILSENSCYEMIDINDWHYVVPIDAPSFSLMITGTPWKRNSPKSTYPLRELLEEEKEELFSVFKNYYSNK